MPSATAPDRRPTMLRQLAESTAAHPRIEAAVIAAIRHELPSVIESLLVDMYGGERLRLWVPKQADRHALRERRDERVRALAASGMAPGLIAKQVGVGLRQVQRILRPPAPAATP